MGSKETSKEGRKLHSVHTENLFVSQVQMPVMDGLQATELIRKDEETSGRHMPIVAMTAHAMAGDAERCINVGMDSYLRLVA